MTHPARKPDAPKKPTAKKPKPTAKAKPVKKQLPAVPDVIKLELTHADLMGYINAFGSASQLPTKRERRAASLELWGDLVDDATPLDALLPPPLGTLVDDVLDIDGRLADAVIGEAAKAYDAARDAFEGWRSKRAERRAKRSTNKKRGKKRRNK